MEYTGWDEQKEYDVDERKLRKSAKEKKARETTDCRTEEGITVGLVDSLISISRILKRRLEINDITPAIQEAIKDLKSDKDFLKILNIP